MALIMGNTKPQTLTDEDLAIRIVDLIILQILRPEPMETFRRRIGGAVWNEKMDRMYADDWEREWRDGFPDCD